MKRIMKSISTVLVCLCFITGVAAWAQSPPEFDADADESLLFTPEELDDLLAPIALYPDPLLAQVLPAATFIDQIDEAARFVRLYGKSARISDQPWDVSVKAVAHYPEVLFMMDQKYDWTVSLGQAFIDQQQEVMDAIQRLRAEADRMGNLVSTPQQQVIVEREIIRIVPAAPEVIYVPQYDPLVVYVERPYNSFGFVSFGTGFTIGAWLNRDCDWHERRVFYHGWRGNGWISRARPHIHDRRNIYINNSYTTINLNHRVRQHDTVRYRDEVRRDVRHRRELPGRPLPPPSRDQRPRERVRPQEAPARPPISAPQPTAPAAIRTPSAPAPAAPAAAPATPGSGPAAAPAARPQPRPDKRDVYRGREIRGTQPAPNSGFGGYGGSKEIKSYGERGQNSRDNMRQLPQQPARADQPSAAPRPVPAPRPVTAPAPQQRPEPAPRPAAAPRQGASGSGQHGPGPAVSPAPGPKKPDNRGEREKREERR